MADLFFISYSSVDGHDFAIYLGDTLAAGPPAIPVWLDQRTLRPGEDWDEQVVDAIKTCTGLIFVMSADSVRPDSVCKHEWVRALRYKKPVIPLLLHREAELPFRLGSREYINCTGAFDAAVARLRNHLAWMASPEGHLQALKDRLSDAERELPRAEAEQQGRIREDIAELQRQIAQQQTVIDNPEAAEQRVQHRIEVGLAGERQPAQPIGGLTGGTVINPPPLIAPTWFQDRHLETQQMGAFLTDEALRLLTVVGRGGVGKSAMVCRLLRALEGGQLPDDGGALAVDGIVYLSNARAFHRVTVPDLYAGLTKLLSDATVKPLDSVYKNPQASTRTIIQALVQAFPRGRTVVLLDNFEDALAVDTGHIKDAELDEALRALLELPPHGLKILITTRVVPSALALVEPGRQRRLDLDTGLEHPYAENILRAMDADGKVGLKHAPAPLLANARERTLGYPRALEHLFGILSADRDTSLQELLDDTRPLLPEQVVTVLVGEAFSRLDLTAQQVMQALAIYRYPVPPAAIDYLLQAHIPGVESGPVLRRLVNMQFARRHAGRYAIHQVDRDYALSRLVEGAPADRAVERPPLTRFALRHRAAEWFKRARKPREAWNTLDDLAAQLAEFELRCEGDDDETAAALLREFDFDYLFVWGHYRVMTELHERLQGKISDRRLAENSVGNLGSAYYRMGQLQRAIGCYEHALQVAQEHHHRWGEGTWLGNLGVCLANLGQHARAIALYEHALGIRREVGNRQGESADLANLSIQYAEIGEVARALEYCQHALAIDREIGAREAEALHLCALGDYHADLGHAADAWGSYTDALAMARDLGSRFVEADAHVGMGALYLAQREEEEAARALAQAIDIADAIGSPQWQQAARATRALVTLERRDLVGARDLAEAARTYDLPLSNHGTAMVLAVVALRQGDVNTAQEAFTAALNQATARLAVTADRYHALDVKGLSLCGLALCADPTPIPAAKAAFHAARTVTSAAGIVGSVLQVFDALAHADTDGILAEVRPIAAGVRSA